MEDVIKIICNSLDNLKNAIKEAVDNLGGFKIFINDGDKVLLKPNFNTADPFPASSDPEFIKAVIELCYESGAGEVIVGESSTFSQNTGKNMEKLGIFNFEKMDPPAKVISFDEGKWIKKKIPKGKYLKSVYVPEILEKIDKLIFLPCLKTHFIAKFTGSLKLSVGLMKPSERLRMHIRHVEEKVAELASLFKPDLIIMDGRKCFITRGPDRGEVREPDIILASTKRLTLDKEAIKILKSFPGNDLEKINIEDLVQIKRAKELGIE